MSVTVKWRQVSVVDNHFEHGGSTSFERLKHACGTSLDKPDIPRLRAMALAADDKFYNEVADIVEQFGPIDIWGEY